MCAARKAFQCGGEEISKEREIFVTRTRNT